MAHKCTLERDYTIKRSGYQRYDVVENESGRRVSSIRSSGSFNTFCKVTNASGKKLYRVPKGGSRKFHVVNYKKGDLLVSVKVDSVTSLTFVWKGSNCHEAPWLLTNYDKVTKSFKVVEASSGNTVAVLIGQSGLLGRLHPWRQMDLNVKSNYDISLLTLILISLIFKGFVIGATTADG